MRAGAALVLALTAGALGPSAQGCAVHGDPDAAAEDTAARDAPLEDAASVDDARSSDTGTSYDGSSDVGPGGPDAPDLGSCVAAGVPGRCVPVSACAAGSRSVPGLCPGPADIQCCVPVSPGICDPDARPLPNAGLTEEPGEGGCPAGLIRVDATFCIQRFEASLVDALTGESLSPFFNPGTLRARAVSLRGAIPQGYINGTQAAAACTESGLRLCTDTEWLRACQGSGGTTYPYGPTREVGRCNDRRDVHPAVEHFGTTEPWIFSELDDACLNQLPMSLAPTGSFSACTTEAGAVDMMGNLHEWTADPAGTFRGGFYVDTVLNGPGCLYRTTAHDVSHWDYSTGFRCCWSG